MNISIILLEGGQGMETVIHNEILHFTRVVESKNGGPIDLEELLSKVTCNVISTVLFGSRFEYDDKELEGVQFSRFLGLNIRARTVPYLKVCLTHRFTAGTSQAPLIVSSPPFAGYWTADHLGCLASHCEDLWFLCNVDQFFSKGVHFSLCSFTSIAACQTWPKPQFF